MTPQFRALLERAASDPAFRAELLAHPALTEGFGRKQIETLLSEMALLNGQLTDEMLDGVVGGLTGRGVAPGCHSTLLMG